MWTWIAQQSGYVLLFALFGWFYWYKVRPKEEAQRQKFEEALQKQIAYAQSNQERQRADFKESLDKTLLAHKESFHEVADAVKNLAYEIRR